MSTIMMFNNGAYLYNNGKVAISKDLIFGLSVYTEDGWIPLARLSQDDLHATRVLIDMDPLCSFLWKEEFSALFKKE
jgi:hypothetical protein